VINNGRGNTAIGHNSFVVDSQTHNTTLGVSTHIVRSEAHNTALGSNAHIADSDSGNTALGGGARVTNSGSNNTALGHHARVTDCANSNIAVGDNACVVNSSFSNTVLGHTSHVTNSGSHNTALGHSARVLDSRGGNTALGIGAHVTDSVDSNTALGHSARVVDSGSSNNAFGTSAHVTNSGGGNTVLGSWSQVTDSDSANIVLGSHAFVLNSGNSNTALGHGSRVSGTALTTRSHSVAIGSQANQTHTSSALLTPNNGGTLRSSTANNQILLGYSGITVSGFAPFTNISDERDKIDMSGLQYDALAFVNAIEPKQYRTDFRSDYMRFEEIDDAQLAALEPYTQQHFVLPTAVYGIEGTDIEWIEDEAILRHGEEAKPEKGKRSVETSRFATRFIGNYVRDRAAALEKFQKNAPVAAKHTTDEDSEANHIETESDDMQVSIVRQTHFLRCAVEPDGSRAGKRFHAGFSAQQVEKAAQDMGFDFAGVKYLAHNKDKNGIPEGDDQYMMQYAQFIAPLVGAVKQLSARVNDLEIKMQALKRGK
jgi:hypothetical protein